MKREKWEMARPFYTGLPSLMFINTVNWCQLRYQKGGTGYHNWFSLIEVTEKKIKIIIFEMKCKNPGVIFSKYKYKFNLIYNQWSEMLTSLPCHM